MEKILLTAFEPFGGDPRNASQEVLNALPDHIGGTRLIKVTLPVVFRTASLLAEEAAESVLPDAVVCLGQAGGRSSVTPERIAVNLMDASMPDNSGYRPADVPVVPGGPAAYFSTLPVRKMTDAMLAFSVPAQLSCSAGLYVCNSLMYSMLRWTSLRCPDVPCGFIHVPYLDHQLRQPGTPSLPAETVVKGIAASLRVLAEI